MLCAAYITRVCRHDRRLKGEGYVRGKEEEKKELSLTSDKNDVLYRHILMLERQLHRKKELEKRTPFSVVFVHLLAKGWAVMLIGERRGNAFYPFFL
jgi:hypothetical protein